MSILSVYFNGIRNYNRFYACFRVFALIVCCQVLIQIEKIWCYFTCRISYKYIKRKIACFIPFFIQE